MAKPDTSSKKVINIYNQAWVEWLLQQQQVKVEAELSGEFQFVARATDSLLQVSNPEGQFLVLTELQFRYDRKMPERLAAYASLARHRYAQPIYVVVVYFIPPAEGTIVVDTFHQAFMGQVARQDFQPVLLWELDARQVLAYDNPALLPFVPLMQGGNTEQMIRRCAERIRQEPQSAELETILALFAGYVLDPALIKQIVRWEMAAIQESPIIRELREEWITKGREEGREEGKHEATLNALQRILNVRFNVTPKDFDERLESLDLEALEQLNEAALRVQTLSEFEAALADILAKLEIGNSHSDNDSGQ